MDSSDILCPTAGKIVPYKHQYKLLDSLQAQLLAKFQQYKRKLHLSSPQPNPKASDQNDLVDSKMIKEIRIDEFPYELPSTLFPLNFRRNKKKFFVFRTNFILFT